MALRERCAAPGKAYPVVYTQGPRAKGDVYLGVSPKPGNLLDSEGRLILVHRYGPPLESFSTCVNGSPPAPIRENHSPAKVTRGVTATIVQPALL